jgi:hypothetical protein
MREIESQKGLRHSARPVKSPSGVFHRVLTVSAAVMLSTDGAVPIRGHRPDSMHPRSIALAFSLILLVLMMQPAAVAQGVFGTIDEHFAHCPGCTWEGSGVARQAAENYATSLALAGAVASGDVVINVVDARPGSMWTFTVRCDSVPMGGNPPPGRQSDVIRGLIARGLPVCGAASPSNPSAEAERFRSLVLALAGRVSGSKVQYVVTLGPNNDYGDSVLDLLRDRGGVGTQLGDRAYLLLSMSPGGIDFSDELNRRTAQFVTAQLNSRVVITFVFPDGTTIDYDLDLSSNRSELDPESARTPGGMRIAASADDFESVVFDADTPAFIENLGNYYRDLIVGPGNYTVSSSFSGTSYLACVESGDRRICEIVFIWPR